MTWWEPTDGYLAHHGIKGQKWGIRRYQNPDGSLTTAGKARYLEKIRLNKDVADGYRYKDGTLTSKGVREKVSKDDLYKKAVEVERKRDDISNKWTENNSKKFTSSDEMEREWKKFERNSAEYQKLTKQAESFVIKLCNKYGNASMSDYQTIWWDIFDYGLADNKK